MTKDVAGQRLRLGIIGCGSVGERHARAAVGTVSVDVVAVTDPVNERAEHVATLGGARVYASAADLLGADEVEAVVVAVPTAGHADVAVAAARAGKHVLCEKPMATTLHDCDRIIEACAQSGTVLLGAQIMQHRHRRLAAAKRRVEERQLGELLAMHVRRCGDYRRVQQQAWKRDPVEAGGGVVLNLATYAIDEFQWFAGASIHRVTARIPRRPDDGQIETEAMALVEMTNGVVASIVELGTDLPGSEEMDLVLTGGSLRLSGDHGLVESCAGRERQVVAPVVPRHADGDQAMVAQLEHFADTVLNGVHPEADGAWQRSLVAVAGAIYDSAITGAPVTVEDMSMAGPGDS